MQQQGNQRSMKKKINTPNKFYSLGTDATSAWLRGSMLFYFSLSNPLNSYWLDANGGLTMQQISLTWSSAHFFFERHCNSFSDIDGSSS